MGRKIKNKASDVKESVTKGDSKLKEFIVHEQLVDAGGNQGESIDWEGREIETKSDPLIDDGSGREVVLRRFDFNLPPIPKEQMPTKEALLTHHKSKVIAFLWKDELELIQDPKIVMSKFGDKFRIFCLCQARKGSLILQKPLTLQEVTKTTNGK